MVFNLLKGIFGTAAMRQEAFVDAVDSLQSFTVAALLRRDPQLAQTDGIGRGMSWLNSFAGLPANRGGLGTLLALHAGGVDVKRGLNLAVAYRADHVSGPHVMPGLLATGVIDSDTINRALHTAEKGECHNTATILRRALPAPV